MFQYNQQPINTVILDRDGVLNQELGDYVKHVSQWQWIDGSIDAIVSLHQQGVNMFVATNQAGIGRGLYTLADLNDIHQKMLNDIHQNNGRLHNQLDDNDVVLFCPHHPDDHCNCRKPSAGMLERIRDEYHVDVHHTIMIGDSQRDLQAAMSIGITPVHVQSGKQQDITGFLKEHNIQSYRSLFDFVASLSKS